MLMILGNKVYTFMKISFWVVGKTSEKYLLEGMQIYISRLKHYTRLDYQEFKDVKATASHADLSKLESVQYLSKIQPEDFVVLLDEKGKQFSSVSFAGFLEQKMIGPPKNVVFIVGGAFGHHQMLKNRADLTLSLSEMTFSHQMVRLIFLEQLYRAYTIIKKEKYHNS